MVIEFGSEAITNRLELINLNHDHLASYQKACTQTSDFMERIYARQTRPFGDISDLSFELLIKARELSRRDPSAAQLIFGIRKGMTEAFATMDIDQIRRVASAGVICFEPRFTPEFATKLAALEASEIDMFLNAVGGTDMESVYDPEYR